MIEILPQKYAHVQFVFARNAAAITRTQLPFLHVAAYFPSHKRSYFPGIWFISYVNDWKRRKAWTNKKYQFAAKRFRSMRYYLDDRYESLVSLFWSLFHQKIVNYKHGKYLFVKIKNERAQYSFEIGCALASSWTVIL